VLAILAAAGTARAEDARRVLVRYDAAPGCPAGDAFRADLARRTPRIALSDADDADRYDVVIVAADDGFEGTLRAPEADPLVQRGRRCADVAQALALTLALSIDPSSKTEVATTPPRAARVVAIALGVDVLPAVLDSGLGGVVAGVESRPAAGAPIPVLFRVRVILAALGKPSDERLSRLALAGVGLDACVFELARGAFSLRPCVGVEPGIAWAEARSGSSARAFWLSTSGRLRGDVALTKGFGITLEGAAVVPLARPRFEASQRTAAEAGSIGAEIALSGWAAFP
jgi:hypothetical protein